MEPTNHPFRKENDLPNLHDYVPFNLQGCISCADACDTWLVVFPWVGKSEVRKDRTVESSMNPWSGYSVGCGVWIQVWLWNRQGLRIWKQSNKLTLAIYGIIYAWLWLYHLCVIRSFFSGYGFQSVPCGFYVHTVDGSEIPNNNHLGCFWKLVMNGINGSQPQLVKLSMMSGSEPSKEPRSWSYAWWILGTLCEGPTFQRFIFLECRSSGKGNRYK